MKSTYTNTPWLILGKPKRRTRLRLFCFPYAGGGASIFRQWQENMPEGIEVCPVQLPGRENRITEPLFTRLSSLVDAIAKGLDPYFDVPFAFFGHSIGAKIAFELARELRRKKGVQPVHLFVSGSRPPHIPEPRPLHMLPEHEFVRELRRYSGTPEAVMQSRDLMEMYLPILRADFSIDETYIYYEDDPLECPVSAFGGNEDKEANREELDAWRQHTLGPFTLQMFQGNHFFLKSSQSLLLDSISEVLLH
ncbi:MAG: putative thioesterase [Desulfobacteraceae bacterium 4484_190.3]|nr:MAG: putative thioesterase [Desulfobacteraceae bacterium 4484_190.3]